MNINEIYEVIYRNKEIIKLNEQINKKNELRNKTLDLWKNCLDNYDCNKCNSNNCSMLSNMCGDYYKELIELTFKRKEKFLKLLSEFF